MISENNNSSALEQLHGISATLTHNMSCTCDFKLPSVHSIWLSYPSTWINPTVRKIFKLFNPLFITYSCGYPFTQEGIRHFWRYVNLCDKVCTDCREISFRPQPLSASFHSHCVRFANFLLKQGNTHWVAWSTTSKSFNLLTAWQVQILTLPGFIWKYMRALVLFGKPLMYLFYISSYVCLWFQSQTESLHVHALSPVRYGFIRLTSWAQHLLRKTWNNLQNKHAFQ